MPIPNETVFSADPAGLAALRGIQFLELGSVPLGWQPCWCGASWRLAADSHGWVPPLPVVDAGSGLAHPKVFSAASCGMVLRGGLV